MISTDEMLDLADKISDVEEFRGDLNLSYTYGAQDILVWIATGMPKPDSRMAATNNRLYYLLTEALGLC